MNMSIAYRLASFLVVLRQKIRFPLVLSDEVGSHRSEGRQSYTEGGGVALVVVLFYNNLHIMVERD